MGQSTQDLSKAPTVTVITTRFARALGIEFLAGCHGHRIGRFDQHWQAPAESCTIACPHQGGVIVHRRGRRFVARDGQAVITPGGTIHRTTDDGSPVFRQHWARIRVTLFGTVDVFSLLTLPDVLDGGAGAEALRLVVALNAAASACARLDLAALARREEMGFALLRLLIAHAAPVTGLGERLAAIERVQPVLRLMEERLDAPLDRLALARAAGLSTSRLNTVFRAAVSASPYAYLLRLRLRRAQDLLTASDAAVGHVAASCGFTDAFHFSRSFKLAFGTSPRAYRRQARDAW